LLFKCLYCCIIEYLPISSSFLQNTRMRLLHCPLWITQGKEDHSFLEHILQKIQKCHRLSIYWLSVHIRKRLEGLPKRSGQKKKKKKMEKMCVNFESILSGIGFLALECKLAIPREFFFMSKCKLILYIYMSTND